MDIEQKPVRMNNSPLFASSPVLVNFNRELKIEKSSARSSSRIEYTIQILFTHDFNPKSERIDKATHRQRRQNRTRQTELWNPSGNL